ncbi:MFS general substrate transporter [Hymenopellis radicata]|nr:MFS general substrate transporter [Hymenopellis radicata]
MTSSSPSLHTARDDYRRRSCNDLLAGDAPDEYESDSGPVEAGGILGRSATEFQDEEISLPVPQPRRRRERSSLKRRAFFIRMIALLCACCLSVGSHYASYVLGPLKSRLSRELGTSHTEFSLLISAFSLNSTWTPLLGGILASTLGTTYTSILATGIIFTGQLVLLIGDIMGDIRLMALGMFIFGLGVSPVAVVQETIIVRFFKSHGLGVSMAFGLIVGKGASFVSARTSYPLTEWLGPRAPFYAAQLLPASRRRSIHNVTEAQALEKVAAKRRVNLREITKLGDVFWAYVGLNILCGAIWSPFTHLAANIIENRYGMTEQDAANQASYLLAGSLIFYPICGFIVDRFKHRPVVVQLLLLSSCLTLISYGWFCLPPSWTQSAKPAIVTFAVGHGFSPLLLVVLVPKIVPLKYVSTALGVHKSLEQTGSTIFQTLAGIALDMHKKSDKIPRHLLNIFFGLNVLQLLSIIMLAGLQRRKDIAAALAAAMYRRTASNSREPSTDGRRNRGRNEQKRGEVFVAICASLIIFAWVLFLGTAWFRLGKKNGSK